MKEYYVTKRALSNGIAVYRGQEMIQRSARTALIDGRPLYIGSLDWYESKENAIARAEQMRRRKILSLKRQIEKLESLRFDQ